MLIKSEGGCIVNKATKMLLLAAVCTLVVAGGLWLGTDIAIAGCTGRC
jgi:hypothetical protein